MVLDNQPATLQVGDQVPFSTGTATVLTANNTVVNTIDYKNTGIILRVLPRANANGNVVLDIEQEISSVAAGSRGAGPNLTPTISQRRVKSSIAVDSGQTVLLAGLISETENKQRQGIPLSSSQIPGVGDAFSHQNQTRSRTELILFIRPTVIKDARRRACHRRGNAHQDEQPPGRHQQSRRRSSNPKTTLTRVTGAASVSASGRQVLLSLALAGRGRREPRRGARSGRPVGRVAGRADAGDRRSPTAAATSSQTN